MLFVLSVYGNGFAAVSAPADIEISKKPVDVDRYIKYVYDQLQFGPMHRISFEPFQYALKGYLNLIASGRISFGAPLSVCDFSLSSTQKRLWVIDINNKKVLFNTLVAHGRGTGDEFATSFSNTPQSHQSSLGFYVTGDVYQGGHGNSLRLHGVDEQFNSNAFERAIVVHGASYVSEQFAKVQHRIGRSHGCPALPVEMTDKIIGVIKGG
jgi:hypothetical protein